jgi:hypothetical protein
MAIVDGSIGGLTLASALQQGSLETEASNKRPS